MAYSPDNRLGVGKPSESDGASDINRKLIVVKMGSKAIVKPDGVPNLPLMRNHVRDIVDLRSQGFQVIMITSAAELLGDRIMQLPENEVGLREFFANLPRDPKDKDGSEHNKKTADAAMQITHIAGQTSLTRFLEKLFRPQSDVVTVLLYEKKENGLGISLDAVSRRAVVAVNGTPLDPDGPMQDNDEVWKLVTEWTRAGHALNLTNTPGVLDTNNNTIDRIGAHWFDTSSLVHRDREIRRGGIKSKISNAQALARKSSERRVAIARSRPRVIVDFMRGDLPDGTWVGRKSTYR